MEAAGYCPEMARLSIGLYDSSDEYTSHTSWDTPPTNSVGSKVG